MRKTALLALAGLVSLMSGCIAAVVPLAAGVAMVRAQTGKGEPKPPAGPPLARASAGTDLRIARTSLTALPAPDAPSRIGNPQAAAFGSYALALAANPRGGVKRQSALLVAANQLRPARANCGPQPPAVFIDLDPGRAAFDPLAPGRADPALADALASLRERGIKVVWFSRLGENFAAPARAALAQAGLDRSGNDELVLMRTIAERKQTRRDDMARRYCPIAMLGDERADFDELYLYLKQPEAAMALDAMIGRGWFLASPFAADPEPANAGATP